MRRGNGEGSIIKLGGKRRRPYAVRVTIGYTPDGKQQYKYLGYYEGKREARAALRQYLVNPYNLHTKDVKVCDLFNDWIAQTKLSKITVSGYLSAYRQAAHLHDRKIRDIKIIDLETAMNALKPSMQTAFKNVFQHIYVQGIKNDVLEKNLADFITPATKPKGSRQPFNYDEIERIKAFKHKYTDIVVILLYTGLRINELLEMEKDNVFLDQRYMVGGKKTAAGQNRIIPIHDNIFETVARFYSGSNKYLIEYDNKPVNYTTFMHTFWKRLKTHLQTTHTPHCTRHTFITYADKHDLNETAVKKIVGHTTSNITKDVYTHKNIQLLLHEVNKLKFD